MTERGTRRMRPRRTITHGKKLLDWRSDHSTAHQKSHGVTLAGMPTRPADAYQAMRSRLDSRFDCCSLRTGHSETAGCSRGSGRPSTSIRVWKYETTANSAGSTAEWHHLAYARL